LLQGAFQAVFNVLFVIVGDNTGAYFHNDIKKLKDPW